MLAFGTHITWTMWQLGDRANIVCGVQGQEEATPLWHGSARQHNDTWQLYNSTALIASVITEEDMIKITHVQCILRKCE